MSRPIVDYKGRRRSKTIAFRVSPEEDEVINALGRGKRHDQAGLHNLQARVPRHKRQPEREGL